MGLASALFLALMAGGIALLHVRAAAEAPPKANPPVTVTAGSVTLTDRYTVTERFAGRLEPMRQTRLAFEQAGLVTEILVEEGDRIAAGAVVARLDTAKLEAERRRLIAEREVLEARRALADATLKRQRALAKKGWQTEQRYDEARYGLAEIAASIVRIDADVASIDVDIAKAVLTAPYTGRVAARFVDEGAVVDPGMAVIEVLETAKRQVRIGVSVEAAQALQTGQVHRLTANGRSFDGRIVSKRPDLQTGTRTVTVLLETDDDGKTPFGDIVELSLDRTVDAAGAWVPIKALTEGRKGLWSIFTIVGRDGRSVVQREAVEILHIDGARAFVRGTLADGASVVVNGTNRVIPGQAVAVAAQG